MEVFRIVHKKWADNLIASGFPARWNSRNIFTIYTAQSRSLASLEMLVHMIGIKPANENFRILVIYIPDRIKINKISLSDLPGNWGQSGEESFDICRNIGDKWNMEAQSAVLEVPSAIIKNEKNYLINPAHKDFQKIKLVEIEPFIFDPRLYNYL
jgi:RES domain-containing protein